MLGAQTVQCKLDEWSGLSFDSNVYSNFVCGSKILRNEDPSDRYETSSRFDGDFVLAKWGSDLPSKFLSLYVTKDYPDLPSEGLKGRRVEGGHPDFSSDSVKTVVPLPPCTPP